MGCYESSLSFPVFAEMPDLKRIMFRIKPTPECISRVIYRGYYKVNKVLGSGQDFEMAFNGK